MSKNSTTTLILERYVRCHSTDLIALFANLSHFLIRYLQAANERTIFLLREDGKKPDYVLDGMTSDVEGNLFIATYNGHKVMKVNPT